MGQQTNLFFLLLLLLHLLLLHTTNFLFLLGKENANFQTGLTFQATLVTLWGMHVQCTLVLVKT